MDDRSTSDCYACPAGDVAVTAVGEIEEVADKVPKRTCADHCAEILASDTYKVKDNLTSAYLEDDRKSKTFSGGDNKRNPRVLVAEEYGNADEASVKRKHIAECIHYIRVN